MLELVQKFRGVGGFVVLVGQSVFVGVLVLGEEKRGTDLGHEVVCPEDELRLQVAVGQIDLLQVVQIGQ